MFGLGFGELVLIFLIALIFIGPKKLPELAKGLGKGLREFQNAAKGFTDDLQENLNETPKETPKEIASAAPQDQEAIIPESQEDKKDSTPS